MNDADLILRYERPAEDWETESLPIGCGALGASVFGGVDVERLVVNEKSLWTGGPGSKDGYAFGNWADPRPGALDEVRAGLAADGTAEPEAVAARLANERPGYGAYQVFGELRIAMGGHPAEEYRRELDLATALARTSYVSGSVRHERTYFASRPDGVLAIRYEADRAGALDLDVSFSAPGNRSRTQDAKDGRITFSGALHDNGLRFEAQIRVLAEGGRVLDTDRDGAAAVSVSGADAVTLLLSAGTDYADTWPHYRGEDPHDRVTAAVDAAAARPYAELRARHLADHRALFDRVKLDLGGRTARPSATDALLSGYGAAGSPDDPAADRHLEELFFQYGRYLLIASSRPGSLPANLQGVWNSTTAPPWGSDYHPNINLQMNYWPAETTNLAETTGPLFDYIDAMRPPGRVTAREMFGARGWVVHSSTNVFGYTGVHDWPTAFWFPEAAAWCAQHLTERWRFGRDEAFLRERAYPVLRELAEFWLDTLVEDGRDGLLVASPSYSPEHGPFTAGAGMAQQIVRDLFESVIEAATALGTSEDAFRKEVETALARLDPGTRIGSWGQLQEWKEDLDDPEDHHRHTSHLFALHPGSQITPEGTPELAAAARETLRGRGDGGTGWSKAWKINFWARLRDGGHAHLMLRQLLRESVLPNLWDTHPPFQIDGNFGATAGVAEMLLQSHGGVVELLPALPDAWAAGGSVTGLRARGDVTVDVAWADGAARRVALRPGRDGALTVRSGLFAGPFSLVEEGSGAAVPVTADGDRITFAATAGRVYVAS